MIIRELLRFSTQHRTLYCYMILSIWIFLLIASMYKYIALSGSTLSSAIDSLNDKQHSSSVPETDDNSKYRKFKEHCMPLSRLVRRDDGGLLEGWRLQGVLLVIRHGDCGPMSHLRDVTSIDCGIDINDSILNRYRSFLRNSTSAASVNHLYWNKIGPFHGFALLPSTERSCLLGQLTYKGTTQLLHVGDLLYRVYAHPLGLHYRTSASRYGASSSTPHSLLNSDEVVLYTTRYRRTFQSAMALLFSFLPIDKWLALNVLESHSMAFCFTDCACPQADFLRHRLNTLNTQLLGQHQTVTALIKWMGSILLQRTVDNAGDDNTPPIFSDSNEVVDAVLTLFCHDAALPCIRQLSNVNSSHTDGDVPIESTGVLESNDVINIDQDDTVDSPVNLNYERINVNKEGSSHKSNINNDVTATSIDSCLELSHISALLSYANWQSSREANHSFYKRIGLMRAYGMIRHIVSYMLKMISGDRTKFVLYSGHDWTLQYLMSALGLTVENTFIPYASRLAFEVYRSEMHTDYYFRVVYNGRDVTQEIDFCEGGKSLRITRDSRGNKADLCPIENIIRFLHEDYFSPLNATNFKDACTIVMH